jgi:hypothetical protein
MRGLGNLRNYQIQRSGAPTLLSSNYTFHDITAKAERDSGP